MQNKHATGLFGTGGTGPSKPLQLQQGGVLCWGSLQSLLQFQIKWLLWSKLCFFHSVFRPLFAVAKLSGRELNAREDVWEPHSPAEKPEVKSELLESYKTKKKKERKMFFCCTSVHYRLYSLFSYLLSLEVDIMKWVITWNEAMPKSWYFSICSPKAGYQPLHNPIFLNLFRWWLLQESSQDLFTFSLQSAPELERAPNSFSKLIFCHSCWWL